MKKIVKIRSIALWALMPLILLITSCTNTDEGVGISGRNMTLSVIMPNEGTTRVELAQDGDSKNFITQWDDADEVQVFITQGNQRYAIGKVGVKNISEDKKNASITFALPEALDLNKPYSIHALSGIEGTMVEDGGKWYLTCTAELFRNVLTYFNAPLYCKMDVENDLYPRLQFKHIGTYEVLHFTNATDKTIKFEHKGFDVEKPWYYKKAVGYLLPEGGVALDTDATVYGDVESEFFYVAAGQTTTLISWYIPTQEKMNGAELKATIDGVAMKSSNKKSSDVNIETGHAYHMYATWDGTNLTFDNGDAGILTVEPNPIEFGSVEAGTTASVTFTVSNTGNADITFEIQSMHTTIFDIPESGKIFTLPKEESMSFTITFSPEAEEKDKAYSEIMTITTNASNATNGIVQVSITGKSESREEERLNQVIPEDLRKQLGEHIPIYDGSNPPNIEGEYIVSPMEMAFDSKGGWEVGKVFSDTYIKFYNQDMINNTLDYKEKEGSSESIGTGCFISGDDGNFSVFFNTESVAHYSYDIYTKEALIISGTRTNDGIKDLYYAFIIVEKSNDPDHIIMDVGDFRSFKDGDGISYPSSWTYVKKRVPAKDWHLPGIMEVKRK
jgi:hypothetical protein